MTSEQVMSAAKDLVNDTINGATSKLNQMSGEVDDGKEESKGDKRLLLCLLFDPCMYYKSRSLLLLSIFGVTNCRRM